MHVCKSTPTKWYYEITHKHKQSLFKGLSTALPQVWRLCDPTEYRQQYLNLIIRQYMTKRNKTSYSHLQFGWKYTVFLRDLKTKCCSLFRRHFFSSPPLHDVILRHFTSFFSTVSAFKLWRHNDGIIIFRLIYIYLHVIIIYDPVFE